MYSGKMIQELDIFKLKSERRNPVLADLFHRMRYMDRRSSGLRKIVNESKKLHGYSDEFQPEFYSTHSSFTVLLKNVNYASGKNLDGGINGGINKTQKKIISILCESPQTSVSAIAETLGMAKRTVENNISQLKKFGLVEREGARKNGRWIVKMKEATAYGYNVGKISVKEQHVTFTKTDE
jgi:predicted HTH transcriptional regulator